MRLEWLGAGRAIVLIHAFPADARMWTEVAQLLAWSHRIGLVDLPGFSGTPADGDTLERWAEALLQALKGNPGAVVAGCSMGGYVGSAMLRAAPAAVAALALVDSRAAADDGAGKAGRDRTIARLAAEGASFLPGLVTDAPGYLTAHTLTNRPDLVELARDMAARVSVQGAIAAQRAMRARPDATELLRTCGKPLAVVHGAEDGVMPVAGARELAASLPRCAFTEVRGAAHFAPLEQPAAVAAALADLARRVTS